jgi:hypothetical protein
VTRVVIDRACWFPRTENCWMLTGRGGPSAGQAATPDLHTSPFRPPVLPLLRQGLGFTAFVYAASHGLAKGYGPAGDPYELVSLGPRGSGDLKCRPGIPAEFLGQILDEAEAADGSSDCDARFITGWTGHVVEFIGRFPTGFRSSCCPN